MTILFRTETESGNERVAQIKREENAAAPNPGSAKETEGNFDSVSIKDGWQEKKEVEAAVRQMLKSLRKNFPQITIWTEQEDSGGRDITAELAEEMGEGIYLFLSDSFLESMKAGSESFDKKSQILLEVMHRLSRSFAGGATAGAYLEENQAVFWKMSEKPQTPREPAQSVRFANSAEQELPAYMKDFNTSRLKLKCGPVSYNTAAAYAKLAHAKSKSAVQTVMQQTQRQIASLRLLAAFSTGEEAAKAKAALRSYQKLLLRGNTKMHKLDEAQLTEHRRKKAVENQDLDKAGFWADQVRRKRVSRKIGDGALLKEGQLEQLQIPGYHKKKYHVRESGYVPQTAPVVLPPVTSVQAGGMRETGGSEFTVVEIQSFE